MKADERHKLKTNQLLVYLNDLPDKLRRHQQLLIAVGAVILLAIGVFWFVRYRRGARVEQAWNDLTSAKGELASAATDPRGDDKLLSVADHFGRVALDHPDVPPVTALAYYFQGHALLMQASQTGMAVNRGGYMELLSKAEDAFSQVLAQPYQKLATPAARLALAGIAKDRGQFDQARQLYDQVADEAQAEPVVREMAKQRRNALAGDAQDVVFIRAPQIPTTSAEVPIPEAGGFRVQPDRLDSLDAPPLTVPKTPSPLVPDTPTTRRD